MFKTLVWAGLALIYSGSAFGNSLTNSGEFELEYRVQWGNSFLGRSIAHWVIDEQSYRLKGTAVSEGALSFFYDFEGKNELSGRITDGLYQPMRFSSDSTYNDDGYVTEVIWDEGNLRPSYKVTPEPELDEVHPLDPDSLDNVLDPFSAMLTALAAFEKTNSCEGEYRIFDGRRRSDVTLIDLGTTTLEADRKWSYKGKATICGSASKMLGGHEIKDEKEKEEETDFEKVKIFVAEVAPGLTMPVRIEIDNFLGDVIVRLNMRDSKI